MAFTMKAPQFRLRWLMGLVAACAVAFAWVRAGCPVEIPILLVGPLAGTFWRRSEGDRGILGGALGGVLNAWIVLYCVSLGLRIPALELLRAFAIMAVFGGILGTIVGTFVWLAAGPRRARDEGP
jgi:hypothetical protein